METLHDVDAENETENMDRLVAAEFKRLGFMAKPSDVARLADALKLQGVEYGEIGIMAACVGYSVAKGARY